MTIQIAWSLCGLLAAASIVAVACRSQPDAATRLAADAETFVRLGLALAERDPDSLDLYAGPPEWRAAAAREQRTLDDVRDGVRRLAGRVAESRAAGRWRGERLLQQARALAARIDILKGARPRFDDESRLLFATSVAPSDKARIAAVRADLDRRLPGRGSLRSRYAAYQRAFVVPESRRTAVLERALAECRRRARDHLALPAAEQLTIAWLRNTPWPAFTRYEGGFRSRLELNASLTFTLDGALDLACHEGYPGHHTIAVLQDAELVRQQHLIEFSLQLRFSPDAVRSEGLASVAADLAFDEAERAAFERTELAAIAGLSPADLDVDDHVHIERLVAELRAVQVDVARQYLDGELEFARAAAQLEDDALVFAPDAFLKFVNEFRTYPVAYVAGAELVDRELRDTTRNERWARYRDLALYTRNGMRN
jgi:hypothetical protein